jgi:hypothetical protein
VGDGEYKVGSLKIKADLAIRFTFQQPMHATVIGGGLANHVLKLDRKV